MKTLKAIMAIAMVIILASCGKSFDAERAQQLCDKFGTSEGLTDKEWDEFASLYEDMLECELEYDKSVESKVKDGMSSSELDRIREKEYEKKSIDADIFNDMQYVVKKGKRQMPEDVYERIESIYHNYSEKCHEIWEKIRERVPRY